MNIKIINGATEFICEDIGGLVGFEYPSVIDSIGDISGRDGAVYLASKFGRRPLSWQGMIKTDVPTQRRALELACRAGGLKTIQFETCDGIAVQTQIEIDRLTDPYKLGRTKYLIEAVAPDWRFISQTMKSVEIGETLIGGGTDIPSDIPTDIYAFTDTSDAPTVENVGNEYSDPVFTIHGPGTRFIVQNKTTDEMFTITHPLGEDDYIVVDTRVPSVLLNGVTSIYSSLSGTFWKIQPGVNDVALIVIGSNNEGTVTIDYSDAFLGI